MYVKFSMCIVIYGWQCTDRSNDKIYIVLLQSTDWVDKGNNPILQMSQLLKFYWPFVTVYRGGGGCNFYSFPAFFLY